jgi:hypothetical protein
MMWVLRAMIGVVIAGGCTADTPSTELPASSAPARDATPTRAASFINTVWTVVESDQVAPGELRVFLSNGTLVMASSHNTSTPAFGTWSYNDGRLTITEEGLKYDVDILELTGDTFRIRIHSPGEPVIIRFAPAEPSPLSGIGRAQ